MNLLLENGLVTEMICGNNFAYLLKDSAAFLSTEYKVLHSQKESCFIKCMKMLYNGRIQFYYLTNAYKPLSDMLFKLDADSFMTIVSNLIANIIEVNNNGFLSCQNIDISYERIYVDPNTYMVKLVYLPVSTRLFEDYFSFENELRTNLVRQISQIETLSSKKTLQFASDLSNGTLTIEDLYNRIKGNVANVKNTENFQDHNRSTSEEIFQLISMNAPKRVVIEVNKPEFLIGRNASIVDGAVSFNRMIGRKHCKIMKNGSQYLITDLQSANGTYINQMRLKPNQPYPIEHGDVIRLADSDFQVVMK